VIRDVPGPMIVAELSANHGGSLDHALAVVDAVAASGAHALKIQTYTPDTMTLDMATEGFRINDPESPWAGETLYALYKRAHLPWEWHAPILERARSLGILAFSSPFDTTAVDFLETMDVPAYKIASFENTDHALIRYVAATGKPLFLSAGLATFAELQESVAVARDAGCTDLVLLKCTSSYPALSSDANLRTMRDMRERFGCEVGVSDHTPGTAVAIAAAALGAAVIEKHVTLRRDGGGVDSAFSLEPDELARMVRDTAAAAEAVGGIQYGPVAAEVASLAFRRSLYVTADLQAGDLLTSENVRAIRPGYGLAPRHLPALLGRRVVRAVTRGTPTSWNLVADGGTDR
jgi:pseudaminic acid synthase